MRGEAQKEQTAGADTPNPGFWNGYVAQHAERLSQIRMASSSQFPATMAHVPRGTASSR